MDEKSAFEIGRLYPLVKAIADTLTTSQKDVFIRLPGLIAYWTGGTRGVNAALSDHSGSALPLSETGVCQTGYDGNPFVHLGDGTNYFDSSAAFFGQSGAAAWIDDSIKGLTLGLWVLADATPSVGVGVMSKSGGVTDRGYAVIWNSTGLQFLVSSNGAATFVSPILPATAVGVWHFVVGRFIPSAEVAIFVDGVKAVLTAGIPATINAPAQNFEIGRHFNDNTRILHGRARDMFICAAALSDQLIEEIRVTSVP